jgi:poly-gamma-glutamate synthesis protein (capsule biosynthesis protein)
MLNYTYGLNGHALPEDKEWMVDLINENSKDRVREDIRRAKEMSDAVIVFPHWGTEYSSEVDDYERKWAQFFADEGVLLVIGTHPHRIQPVEWYTGKDGNRMLCYYSVGNYISAQTEAESMLGLMAKLTLNRKSDGTVEIKEYSYEPLVTHISPDPEGFTTYKLSEYTEEMAEENVILRYDDRFSLSLLEETINSVMK